MIAISYSNLPGLLRDRMKLAPFLLGYQRESTVASGKARATAPLNDDDDDDGPSQLTYALCKASDLAINDDPSGLQTQLG